MPPDIGLGPLNLEDVEIRGGAGGREARGLGGGASGNAAAGIIRGSTAGCGWPGAESTARMPRETGSQHLSPAGQSPRRATVSTACGFADRA